MFYETTIEESCAYAFDHPPYCAGVLEACMRLIHFEEWRQGKREGDITRMYELATKYGAKFKDTNFDMLFRAEYKMLKGPMPPYLMQLIYMCWDFCDIKPPIE